MKSRAEDDGAVFLPNPEPAGPVEYVFVCMEPSLGRWAGSSDKARSRVRVGFRNFLSSIEDFILHYCIREYLCAPTERYHITDLSKGAMLVGDAGKERSERYDRWHKLLENELDLVAAPGARVFAVGDEVAKQFKRRRVPWDFDPILHYSSNAGKHRNDRIPPDEDRFERFRSSVSLEDVLRTAKDVLTASAVPSSFREETLERLARRQLTESRRKLMFIYKRDFER